MATSSEPEGIIRKLLVTSDNEFDMELREDGWWHRVDRGEWVKHEDEDPDD